ncbi:MarR family winged helix-turn-helix transcriptional regulator [Jeotgalibacillus soli]|uniref:MarR family transcriptional regulator n=1 Tax=Jeotgalibacillus soli TaxID=889306 RepID=A0A0C2V8I5_9BACL|nr:MarR family transcriptional regulator [Jeotgalibacillus soli]KIL45272.1 MarR family transcriptional regulator [Jeotgalibacillus soli]
MQHHELLHGLHQLSRHLTNNLNEALKAHGLFSAQWSVIYALTLKGPKTQKDLCLYLGIEAPPMSRNLQRMEKQGWIIRKPGKDKRERYIHLTEAAINKYPEWEAAVSTINHQLVNGLSETEQEQMKDLLWIWLNSIQREKR